MMNEARNSKHENQALSDSGISSFVIPMGRTLAFDAHNP